MRDPPETPQPLSPAKLSAFRDPFLARSFPKATLGNLGSRNALHREAIVRAGAANALVELLYTGTAAARAVSADALRTLADTDDHQLQLLQAQAVPALAALIRARFCAAAEIPRICPPPLSLNTTVL